MKKKIIRPEGPVKKIILLRFCPKKNILARTKNPSPPPALTEISNAHLWATDKWLISHLQVGYKSLINVGF